MTEFSKVHDLHRLRLDPTSPSALLNIAELTLIEAGAILAGTASPVSATAHYHRAHPTATIHAQASLIESRDALTLWRVALSDTEGRALADCTLTYLANGADAAPPADPAARPEPEDHFREPLNDKLFVIAQAACGVISEKGFAAATIREIAAAAGMHVPTMYQYVRSKEEVLEQVYHMVIARVNKNVGPAFDLDLPPREKLMRVIESFLRNNGSMRKEAGVLNRELRSLSPKARQRVLANYKNVTERIGTIISDGIASGEFRKVNVQLMANMIDALCDMWALRPFALTDIDENEYLTDLKNLLFRGVCTDSSAGAGGEPPAA